MLAEAAVNDGHAPETAGYVLTHTMLRIKDPQRSLAFYKDVLGMHLLKHVDFPEARFSVYFLAMAANHRADLEGAALTRWMFSQSGFLELTHNWGTELDPQLRMHDGNEAPRGYGHICICVPDIEAACARFDRMGVRFHKRLGEGGMKEIAFICDPDGYRYEIVQASLVPRIINETE
jgi:lactoylglutathione lyase